jgi:excisionase family DNA binding protein
MIAKDMDTDRDDTTEAELKTDGFLSVDEAARFLRLSRSSVYKAMDAGELTYAKFGKSRRIPRRALRQFIERAMVGAQ